MNSMIEVRQLSKSFRKWKTRNGDPAIKQGLWQSIQSNFFQQPSFFALNNINFSILPGTTLGIIGKNGAGKSTLIKIISKIIPPTKGRIILRGSVSSLVEIGTGFHPDLTGEENIYLNGAFLGVKKQAIKEKFSQIVAFAEVQSFLSTPLKKFSTGMQLRLAFSIAVYLNADILILDEILAVGDAAFQKKCLEKINHMTKIQGKTVLLVSHDSTVIERTCDQCLWLENGRQMAFGKTSNIIGAYHQHSNNF